MSTNQTLGEALQSPDPADRVRWWCAAGISDPIAGRLGSALADDVERLTTLVAKLNAVCAEYEEGGYGDPGRAIDSIRDLLGRRN